MSLIKAVKGLTWDRILLFFLIGFVIYLVVIPLGMVIFSSFKTVAPNESGPFTFANYSEAYLSKDTYELLLNTILFTIISLFIGLSIGIFFAWLVERTNTPFRNLGFALVPLTIAMPSMLYGIAWLLLLSPQIGLVNLVLMHIFDLKKAILNPYSIVGMGFVEGLRLASTIFLMVVGIFRSMDPSLEEAAYTSGANVLSTSRYVTLKLMTPGILSAAIYSCTTAFDSFEIPAVLGIPRGIHVFATKIYLASHEIPRNYGMASTLGVILLVFAVFWILLYGRVTRLSEKYTTISGKGYRARVIDLGRWKYLGTACLFIHFTIVVVAPMAILVWGSLLPYYEVPSLDALSKISLDSYREILNYPWLIDSLKNTILLILIASTATVVLSAVIAWVVVRTRLRGRRILDVLTFLPHGIPGIVMGLAFMWLYLKIQFIPIYGTIWIMALAFITRHLAYGARSMNSAMLQIHKELEEAGSISGASWLTTFFHITIPLLLPSIIATWIWSAMHVSRQLSISVMLYSQKSRVLPVLIWDLWQSGEASYTCAIGVMLMIFLALMLFTGRIIAMRRSRQF